MDTKYKDSFIVEGKLALPYQYFAGRKGGDEKDHEQDRQKPGHYIPHHNLQLKNTSLR